ncbi:LysM peptidoglycan-binding domain-containing protein [Pontibacter sp. JH31]|uniref:LysM peptidoglycan-binding domain-containing protein n=1 Tax=Pontibacter aquaedesilientis TaxID=2766980 RepID=A0ABR7XKT8_9BACT|nr:LysM peptidoglycan-binding domain-containing protein [Pontibacter aquaedesilientis]MBD1398021.1 LysM peptidoglycan-binding domain-containing protein [Pontibacter aquaedesilientis]
MGLRDFFKRGKEEPAKAPNPTNRQPGDSTFFKQNTPEQPTAQPTSQDTYTVKSGDSLSKIAKHYYGDANAWKKIYEANKATIGDNPDLIKPGQQFVIPKQ